MISTKMDSAMMELNGTHEATIRVKAHSALFNKFETTASTHKCNVKTTRLPIDDRARTLDTVNPFLSTLHRHFRPHPQELRLTSECDIRLTNSWAAAILLQLSDKAKVWANHRFWAHASAGVAGVSNGSKFPGRFRIWFQPGTEPLHRVSTQNPLLKSQHFPLQLSISVLIVSQHEQSVYCAVLVAPSPPAFRLAIRQVLVESRSKTRQFRFNSAIVSQPLNEYQSDRKSESGR